MYFFILFLNSSLEFLFERVIWRINCASLKWLSMSFLGNWEIKLEKQSKNTEFILNSFYRVLMLLFLYAVLL